MRTLGTQHAIEAGDRVRVLPATTGALVFVENQPSGTPYFVLSGSVADLRAALASAVELLDELLFPPRAICGCLLDEAFNPGHTCREAS
jgi:hypothetical protein